MYSANLYLHLAFGITLTVIAYGITWAMSRFVRIMDVPNHRSAHVQDVPRSGGVSIVLTFYLGLLITWQVDGFSGMDTAVLLSVAFSALLIAVISLVDDITDQSAFVKLVTQMVAVVVVMWAGVTLDQLAFPGMGYVDLGAWGYVISFFWILGLTNAYNFMDGLDGLAGGTAAIAAMFFLIITFFEGSHFVYIISYSLLAGALGFLFLNFPPAKIILGDVGAVFLGFVFAVLAIVAARYDVSRTSFLVIPLLTFNFIYDTGYTFLKRLIEGKNVFQAHREHLYQRMHQSGFSHMEVVLTQYCMVFLQGLGALWIVQIPGNERLLVFVPFLLFQVAYTLQVNKLYRKSQKGKAADV